ncbi:MAG: UvrD-helicase domain-containing protein [Deltaproteobacteria bacterium]|nr:UvrD-helicase domain-containing protein [Deltaproteobacteria bacterium]
MTEKGLPSYLQDLNPPQLEAVKHLHGPILILAGAGSGKTRVLTRRVAHLVLGHRVHPKNILAITFTNKAAGEMKKRLQALLGKKAEDLWMSTFHAAGLRILRHHAQLLSYKSNFVVYDEQDSTQLLKTILKQMNLDEKKDSYHKYKRAIDRAKNNLCLPEDYEGSKVWNRYESLLEVEVYERYQQALFQANAMDFNDLLLNTVLLFQKFPNLLEHYRQQLHFMLVDEFQDTNKAQYVLVRQLAEPRQNLLVVGDDDQSIYTFRGATVQNILEFEQDFPNTKVVKLEQNYRSSGNILEGAHAIISKNFTRQEKQLWTEAPTGAPIFIFAGEDESEEAKFIATRIQQLHQNGRPLSEIAIFYRTNAQSRALEEALVHQMLPYRIYGGQKFYERKEIKDILAYLRLIVNRSDHQSFVRSLNTPPRGIGAQTLAKIVARAKEGGISLWEAACSYRESLPKISKFLNLIEELSALAKHTILSELVRITIEKTGYNQKLSDTEDSVASSRLENLRELQATAYSLANVGETPIESLILFLDRISLISGDETPQEQTSLGTPLQTDKTAPLQAISLMTLHLAKGLEFPVVFLSGMEEGLLPHWRTLSEVGDVDEERRLCYVGMTRAKEELYLTRAYKRGLFSAGGGLGNGNKFREISRFIYDIPTSLLWDVTGHSMPDQTQLDPDSGSEDLLYPDELELENGWPKKRKKKTSAFKIDELVKPADEL